MFGCGSEGFVLVLLFLLGGLLGGFVPALFGGCGILGVVALLGGGAVDELAHGALVVGLFGPELFVVADVVGTGYDVGVEREFDVGGVGEVAVAVDVVADVAGVLDGVEVEV